MISRNEVAGHLMVRGLLSAEAIVDGRVRVVDASRRNYNCQVISDGGPSYFVKQQGSHSTLVSGMAGTVAYEAAVLSLLHTSAHDRKLNQYLPRLIDYDAISGALVLESIPNAENLRHYHVRIGRIPVWAAEAIGKALGTLHAHGARLRLTSTATLSEHKPEVFSLNPPTLELLRATSAGNTALIAFIQRFPQLGAMVQVVGRSWRADQLIHGDPRWDNWLLRRANGRRPRLTLVDWELASMGDPGWDVGSVFGEYLASWILSIPSLPGVPLDRAVLHATCTLEQVQPAMRRFWEEYSRARGLDPAGTLGRTELLRALCFTAAKLIHVGSELMHRAHELTSSVGALLQVASNLLADPEEAAAQLVRPGPHRIAAA
jgi:hypothetical protein